MHEMHMLQCSKAQISSSVHEYLKSHLYHFIMFTMYICLHLNMHRCINAQMHECSRHMYYMLICIKYLMLHAMIKCTHECFNARNSKINIAPALTNSS